MVGVCPLIDSFDYAFQVNHESQWRWLQGLVEDYAAIGKLLALENYFLLSLAELRTILKR